jgi:hypothetical protein
MKKKRVLVGIEPTIQTYLRKRAVFKFLCTRKSELALIYICLSLQRMQTGLIAGRLQLVNQ